MSLVVKHDDRMDRGRADLRLAIRKGFFVVAIEGLGQVEVRGRFIRYDPAIPVEQRARAVLGATRLAPLTQKSP